jgi:hypothetical protein
MKLTAIINLVFNTVSANGFFGLIRYTSVQGYWRLSSSVIQEMRAAVVEVDDMVYNTALATCVSSNELNKARFLLGR